MMRYGTCLTRAKSSSSHQRVLSSFTQLHAPKMVSMYKRMDNTPDLIASLAVAQSAETEGRTGGVRLYRTGGVRSGHFSP